MRYKEVLSATLTSIDLGPDAIPEEEVEGFARNVAAVGIVKGTSLVERKTLQGPSRDVFGEFRWHQRAPISNGDGCDLYSDVQERNLARPERVLSIWGCTLLLSLRRSSRW